MNTPSLAEPFSLVFSKIVVNQQYTVVFHNYIVVICLPLYGIIYLTRRSNGWKSKLLKSYPLETQGHVFDLLASVQRISIGRTWCFNKKLPVQNYANENMLRGADEETKHNIRYS